MTESISLVRFDGEHKEEGLFVCFWRDSPRSGPGPPLSQGFYIKHDDIPQTVGLLWTSDQLVSKTST
jgi:hypothetical protein